MKNLALAFFFLSLSIASHAQCEDFNSYSLTGWISNNTCNSPLILGNWHSRMATLKYDNLNSQLGASDKYLHIRDIQSGSCTSWVFNNLDFNGDWSNVGECLCYDFNFLNDGGIPTAPTVLQIFSGAPDPFSATYVAEFKLYTPISLLDGWVKICPPLHTGFSGLPANSIGFWEMQVPAGGGVADWNNLISNVSGIALKVDLNPGLERFALDNICIQDCPSEQEPIDPLAPACCPGWPQSIPNGSLAPTPEIQVASNGDVFVTGGLDAPATIVNCGNIFNIPGPGGFLAKYNSCGKLIWVKPLSMPGVDLALYETGGITNIFLVGHRETAPFGSFITRFNDYGTSASITWTHSIPGLNNLTAIDIDDQSDIYLVGNYKTSINLPNGPLYSATNDFSAFLAKYEGATGNHVWSQIISNTSLVDPSCGAFRSSLEVNGIAVNGAGSSIYVLGSGRNATLSFGGIGGCALAIIPSNSLCKSGDVFVAAYEGSGNTYTCQWAEKISGVGVNAPSGIACDKTANQFYFAGWVTNASTSASGFILPPLSGPPNDRRGHFIAMYNFSPGGSGDFGSVYRDDFTSQSQFTDHFEDVFWDKENDLLYVTATLAEAGFPYLHKHNPSSIASPVWVFPQPPIDATRGHSSVATNGLSNAGGFKEVFITGGHDAGVLFNVSTSSGIAPVSFPHSGIFVLKIEDQGANAIIKE